MSRHTRIKLRKSRCFQVDVAGGGQGFGLGLGQVEQPHLYGVDLACQVGRAIREETQGGPDWVIDDRFRPNPGQIDKPGTTPYPLDFRRLLPEPVEM